MTQSLRICAGIALLFASAAATPGQPKAALDEYIKSIDALVEKNKEPHVVAAEVDEGRWQRFSLARDLETFREKHEVYNVANLWLRYDRPVFSAITLSSPSGDWAKYLRLYFREDGTLARSESELRTFYGDLVVRQVFHFDAKGKQSKKTLEFFDLKTGKRTKPGRPALLENEQLINDQNYFLRTTLLPFAKLIK